MSSDLWLALRELGGRDMQRDCVSSIALLAPAEPLSLSPVKHLSLAPVAACGVTPLPPVEACCCNLLPTRGPALRSDCGMLSTQTAGTKQTSRNYRGSGAALRATRVGMSHLRHAERGRPPLPSTQKTDTAAPCSPDQLRMKLHPDQSFYASSTKFSGST